MISTHSIKQHQYKQVMLEDSIKYNLDSYVINNTYDLTEDNVESNSIALIELCKPCYKCSHNKPNDNTCIYCNKEHRCFSS